ncbi:MAG: hypothetical protein ACXWNK_03110, partial [Vulcanimicrobiaceae bacterium]
MRRRLRAGFAAVAVLIVLAVLVWHHAVARFAVASIIGLTTGYRVDIGEMRLGRNHGAFLGTHISRKGEPVLDATRIDLYYSLRDLLPGSKHRFGLLGVTIDQPQLTIVHHQDRTYNITSPGGGAPATPGRPNEVPLNFTVRVRGGQAQLIDDYTYYKEARLQGLQNINADVSINTATRTKYLVTGAITCAIGVLVGLPALRLSGLYLALTTLMFAGAANIILTAVNFPNGGHGFTGHTSAVDLSGLQPVGRPGIAGGDTAYYRYTIVVCALMFLLIAAHFATKP